MTTMEDLFGPAINEPYGAAQGVEDGYLVKVPDTLTKPPIYLSAALYALVEVPEGMEGHQDLMGRMADVVNMARLAFSGGDRTDRMRTNIEVILAGHGTVKVWGVIDGDGLTLMLPSDY